MSLFRGGKAPEDWTEHITRSPRGTIVVSVVTQYTLVDITDISEKCTASVFRVELFYTENRGNTFLRNVEKFAMSHPKRPYC
jgi:hypothetical protein